MYVYVSSITQADSQETTVGTREWQERLGHDEMDLEIAELKWQLIMSTYIYSKIHSA